MLKKMELEKLTANNKKRFIEMQLNDQLKVHKREMIDINRDLHRFGFTTQAVLNKMHDDLEANVKSIVNFDEADEEVNEEGQDKEKEKEKENEFGYLMDMPIRSFTNKKIRELADSVKKIETELGILTSKNEKDLWMEDLTELEKAYVRFEKEWEKSHLPTDKKKNDRKKRVVKKNAVKNKENNEKTKKDDDKKGPKPKKLPGFDDESSDTSSIKGKDKAKANKENIKDLDKSQLPKKERKPRVKKEDGNDNTAKKVKTRNVKKTMLDIVDDDSFSMSDVVSEEESFIVNNNKNKKKKN